MAFVAAILAGGASRRFGANKALAQISGRPMLAHVAQALADAKALAVVGNSEGAALLQASDLSDPPEAVRGPLAGVLAALDWAQSLEAAWLVTAPCDTPLLPREYAETLISRAETAAAPAAHACTDDGLHALCSAWRPSLAARLREWFDRGVHPPVRTLAPDAVHVYFQDANAFLNINTTQDFANALARLGSA